MLHKTVERYIIQIGGLICFCRHPLNIPFSSMPILQIYYFSGSWRKKKFELGHGHGNGHGHGHEHGQDSIFGSMPKK
jgi:hypothetical protein